MNPILFNFKSVPPRFRYEQGQALEWLAHFHGKKNSGLFARVGCGPERIGFRGSDLADFSSTDSKAWDFYSRDAENVTSLKRTLAFEKFANEHIAELYGSGQEASPQPTHMMHVTCTGYVSPSPAQRLVGRLWSGKTEVTHLYHMGCYAAVPAIRLAKSLCLSNRDHRVDVVHTELCSLHLDLRDLTAEKAVIQSLFGDGSIKYSVASDPTSHTSGLEVVAIHELIVPESEELLTWKVGDHGMQMTLSRDVPAVALPPMLSLLERLKVQPHALYAIHPGGPKILDMVSAKLTLDREQIQHSVDVLYNHGNMSSATLPHIWQAMLLDADVPSGQDIVSVAFGPGLTVFVAHLRKVG